MLSPAAMRAVERREEEAGHQVQPAAMRAVEWRDAGDLQPRSGEAANRSGVPTLIKASRIRYSADGACGYFGGRETHCAAYSASPSLSISSNCVCR